MARLAIASGASVPSNWYRLVRPFSFYLHKVTQQKGGVTILNNVIDPTKGESVRLDYQLTSSGSVTATVFTLDGDVVARIVNASSQAAGDYVASWNGKNLSGKSVARGMYFIRIVAPRDGRNPQGPRSAQMSFYLRRLVAILRRGGCAI